MMNIKKWETPHHTPNADPAERGADAVGQLLRQRLNASDKKMWNVILPYLVAALNFSTAPSIDASPAELYLGRIRNQNFVPLLPGNSAALTRNEYLAAVHRGLQYKYEIIRKRIQHQQEKRRDKVNKTRYPHKFEVNQYVMLLNKNPAAAPNERKLRNKYDGPFLIIKAMNRSLNVIPWFDADRLNEFQMPGKFKQKFQGDPESKPFYYKHVSVDYVKPYHGEIKHAPNYDPFLVKKFLNVIGINWPNEDNISEPCYTIPNTAPSKTEDLNLDNATISRGSSMTSEQSSSMSSISQENIIIGPKSRWPKRGETKAYVEACQNNTENDIDPNDMQDYPLGSFPIHGQSIKPDDAAQNNDRTQNEIRDPVLDPAGKQIFEGSKEGSQSKRTQYNDELRNYEVEHEDLSMKASTKNSKDSSISNVSKSNSSSATENWHHDKDGYFTDIAEAYVPKRCADKAKRSKSECNEKQTTTDEVQSDYKFRTQPVRTAKYRTDDDKNTYSRKDFAKEYRKAERQDWDEDGNEIQNESQETDVCRIQCNPTQ